MWENISSLEGLLWYTSIVGYVVLLVRLYATDLMGTYRGFALCIAAQLAQSVVLLTITALGNHVPREAYAYAYIFTTPLIWVTYILVVLEVYTLVLQRFEGISTLSRWALRVVLGVAIVAALVTAVPEMNEVFKKYSETLSYFSLVERAVVSSLVFFLLLIAGFLLWFPVPLTRNAVVHTTLFCCFFLTIAAGLFFRDSKGSGTRLVSTAMLGIGNLCLLLWVVLLRPSGESTQVVSRPSFAREDEEKLLSQLDAVNAALLRSYRK